MKIRIDDLSVLSLNLTDLQMSSNKSIPISYYRLIKSRVSRSDFRFAFAESRLLNIELRAPVEKENAATPRSIRKIENHFSRVVSEVISPYPTVVSVVTV